MGIVKKKLRLDNSVYLIWISWWLNGNYIGNALSTEPGTNKYLMNSYCGDWYFEDDSDDDAGDADDD